MTALAQVRKGVARVLHPPPRRPRSPGGPWGPFFPRRLQQRSGDGGVRYAPRGVEVRQAVGGVQAAVTVWLFWGLSSGSSPRGDIGVVSDSNRKLSTTLSSELSDFGNAGKHRWSSRGGRLSHCPEVRHSGKRLLVPLVLEFVGPGPLGSCEPGIQCRRGGRCECGGCWSIVAGVAEQAGWTVRVFRCCQVVRLEERSRRSAKF
mmetsp:Transcript_18523/g.46706  ORF Transcript_18523/g.46706 Transcript_18523/m.46706 type:complete len:204 (-) Transcript_18523:138-749(-)